MGESNREEQAELAELDSVKNFDPQQVKMCPAKHLVLEKFEAIDMPFHDPVVPPKPESRLHSGIVSTNPVDKTAEFAHMTRFGSVMVCFIFTACR